MLIAAGISLLRGVLSGTRTCVFICISKTMHSHLLQTFESKSLEFISTFTFAFSDN